MNCSCKATYVKVEQSVLTYFRRFFFLGLLSEELELLLEDELLSQALDELDKLTTYDELLLSESLSLSLSALACEIILGMFFKCSRRSSRQAAQTDGREEVDGESDILRSIPCVMCPENIPLCSHRPSTASAQLSKTVTSESSWNKIFMKMRDDEVVASSVS